MVKARIAAALVLLALVPLGPAFADVRTGEARPASRPSGGGASIDLEAMRLSAAPRPDGPWLQAIITAARGQVGETVVYDPAYLRLDFPGGDVPRDRGVCTDVIIRALRDGAEIDLQRAVNRDMKAAFASYPQNWGLSRPDPNIDHRRVPNLGRLLKRVGAELPEDADFLPGDIVTSLLPGNLPHIMIVSDRQGVSGPLVLHNIGAGAREEDALRRYPLTGHYRLSEDAFARLRQLDR